MMPKKMGRWVFFAMIYNADNSTLLAFFPVFLFSEFYVESLVLNLCTNLQLLDVLINFFFCSLYVSAKLKIQ